MNFYKRFIGDIQRDTGHLSLSEMGAYDRLLDHYYATEEKLPSDIDACYRIARAMSKEERKAVDSVIRQYFVLDSDGYSQNRAEKEIAEAQPKISAARTNGAKGGRPKKNPTETQEKPTGFSEKTQQKPNSKASQSQSQKPEILDTPENTRHAFPVKREEGAPSPEGLSCKAMIETGIDPGSVNPSHPKLRALIDAGASPEEFESAAREAVAKGNKKFSYVLGIVGGRREDASKLKLHPGGKIPPADDFQGRDYGEGGLL